MKNVAVIAAAFLLLLIGIGHAQTITQWQADQNFINDVASQVTVDVIGQLAPTNCNGANQAVTYSSSSQTFGCQTISGGSGGGSSFPLTGNVSAGGYSITNLAAPTAAGQALSEGSAIGAVSPAAGTFSRITAITPLSISSGGTGTTTPGLVAGTNITLSGAWPNQTINAATGGGSSYPNGAPAQIGGFSAINTAEAETLGGDCALTRSGANAYNITCTKTGGTAFAASATTNALNASNISSGTLNLARLPFTLSGNINNVGTVSGSLVTGDFAKFDANGNLVDGGTGVAGSGTVSTAAGPQFAQYQSGGSSTTVVGSTMSGDCTLAQGGAITCTGVHYGSFPIAFPTSQPVSGGIPYYSGASTLAYSTALTSGLPVLGGGAGAAPFSGARSGNTTTYVTTTGTLTAGDCVDIDTHGNMVDAGAACGAGGGAGSGTVSSSTVGQLAIFTGSTTVAGLTTSVAPILGGTGCQSATTFEQLTATTVGTVCTIIDANSCSGVIASGGGLTTCPVVYDGTNWDALEGAASGGSSGTINSGSAGQVPYYQAAGTTLTGVNIGGDCTFTAGNLSCTKTGGTPLTGAATMQLPVSIGNGGTGCATPATFATLPTAVAGKICTITDAQACTDGTADTIGGGSITCTLDYNGANWMPINGNLGGGGTGTINTGTGPQIPQYATGSGNTLNAVTVSGDAQIAQGGAWSNIALHYGTNPVALPSAPPTSGGIPYYSSSLAIASSAALTANLPVIGGGAGVAPSSGTRSGNTTDFVTTTGSLTSGDCVKIDASGNMIDAGAACGSGSGSIPSGTSNQIPYYASSGTTLTAVTVGGDCTFASGNLTCLSTNGTNFAASATTNALNASNISSGTLPIARLPGPHGASTLTAHGLLIGEGTTNFTATAAGSAGQIPVGQTTSTDPAMESVSGDCTLAATGAITCTKTSGTAFAASATTNALNASNISSGTLPAAQMPLGITATPSAAQILVGNSGGTAYAAVSVSGDCTISAAGALSCTKTAGTAFTGAATMTLPVSVANGGTGLASGTSGGVLAYTATGTLASSGALTANLPVIGGGAGAAPTVGTRSGNTTDFVTTTGSLTSGDCVKIDASGNMIDAGSACGAGGGGGTVNSGTSGQLAYYASTGTAVSGATLGGDCTFSSPNITCTKTGGTAFAASATTNALNASNISSGTLSRSLEVNPVHTLSGATPVAAVNSGTIGGVDVEELPLSANVTSFTLPGSGSLADNEEIIVKIRQPASGGPYTLPAGSAGTIFTAGSGTTIVNTVSTIGGCPAIGTSAGNELFYDLLYRQALTEWVVDACTTNPAQNMPYDAAFSMSGTVAASQIFPAVATRTIDFPGSFANSQVSCGTSPTTADGYLIKVAGTEIGAVCLSTSCAPTWCTGSACTTTCTGGTGAAQTVSAGNRIEIDAPSTVYTEANIGITLAGTR